MAAHSQNPTPATVAISEKDLAKIECFSELPVPVLQKITASAQVRTLLANETLYTIGQYDAFECIAIRHGSVKITRASRTNGDMSIEVVGAGGVIGLDMVLADNRDVGSAIAIEALEETSFIGIESDVLLEAISESLEATAAFVRYFACLSIEASFSEVDAVGAQGRIFSALLAMVERSELQTGGYYIAEMPKHRELAEIAGVTDVEAAEAVATLLRQGIATRDYPGLKIENYLALEKLAT